MHCHSGILLTELPGTVRQTLQTISRSLCLSQSQSHSNCTQPIRRFTSHSQSAIYLSQPISCLDPWLEGMLSGKIFKGCELCCAVHSVLLVCECSIDQYWVWVCMFVCLCSDRDVPGSRPNLCVQLFTSQRKAFVYICLGHFFGQYLSFVTLSHFLIVRLASFIHHKKSWINKLSIDVWFVSKEQYLAEKIAFKVVQMFKSS